MFEAVRTGKVKAIWIMATNPMVSMPDTNKIHEALSNCEWSSSPTSSPCTDTMDMAHVQLPAAAWGEKDGTVTNSERVILAPAPAWRPARPRPSRLGHRRRRGAVAAGVDFFALSFVRKGEDVRELRALLHELKSDARIIAKIEDQAGVRNLEEIVREADSLMVARGDLGIEIDYHRLPQVQTHIVDACLAQGKPVIVATHLLESMISAPMPTRAEISDIANAVRERSPTR